MAGGVLDSSQAFHVKVILDTSDAERSLTGLGELASKPIKTSIVPNVDRNNQTGILNPDRDDRYATDYKETKPRSIEAFPPERKSTSVLDPNRERKPTSVLDSNRDDKFQSRISLDKNKPTGVFDPDRDDRYAKTVTHSSMFDKPVDPEKHDTSERYPKLNIDQNVDRGFTQPDENTPTKPKSFFGDAAATGEHAVQKGIDKTGDVVSGGLNLASKGLESFGDSLKEIQGPLGIIGDKMNTVKTVTEFLSQGVSKLPIVGEALGKMGTAASGLVDPLKGVLESLTAMTAKSNPGLFNLWQKSLDNVQATLGSRFVPVLKEMIKITDKAGDTLASILPNAAELEKDLQPLISALAELNKEESEFNAKTGPTIREGVRAAIKVLSSGMGLLVEGSIKASKAITGLTSSLFQMIGLGDIFKGVGGGAQEGERHRDFAARPASYQDVNSYESKFQTDAFGSGGTVADMKPEEIKGPLADIATKLGIIADAFIAVAWDKLTDGWNWLQGAWEGIEVGWDWLKGTGWNTLVSSLAWLTGIANSFVGLLDNIKSMPGLISLAIGLKVNEWSRYLANEIEKVIPKPFRN